MSHSPHPASMGDVDGAILYDHCADCKQHAATPGLSLDSKLFRLAWQRMIDVELGSQSYRSDNEAELCRRLYQVYVLLERHVPAPFDPITLTVDGGAGLLTAMKGVPT